MPEVHKNIGINYGAISDPISKQLKDQGLEFDEKTIANLEKCLDGLIRCRIQGILVDSAYNKALPKLHKKVMEHIAKANKKVLVKS